MQQAAEPSNSNIVHAAASSQQQQQQLGSSILSAEFYGSLIDDALQQVSGRIQSHHQQR